MKMKHLVVMRRPGRKTAAVAETGRISRNTSPKCDDRAYSTRFGRTQRTSQACRCWLLAIGYWLLAIGCWLLAVGCWLLANCVSLDRHGAKQPAHTFAPSPLRRSVAPSLLQGIDRARLKCYNFSIDAFYKHYLSIIGKINVSLTHFNFPLRSQRLNLFLRNMSVVNWMRAMISPNRQCPGSTGSSPDSPRAARELPAASRARRFSAAPAPGSGRRRRRSRSAGSRRAWPSRTNTQRR